ncbi:MAG TPA: GNVR domain-containing protein [bacterium]|nr:GNVR domain-containing protein [bacterium]HRQ70048.1 GNVR domain-containing protein [bacterium]
MEKELGKEKNEISLKDVYLVLVNNKKLYLIFSILTFCSLAVIFLFFLTPVYEVNASLEIRQQNASPLSINPMAAMLIGGTAMSDKTIDYEVLRSRRILNSIIENKGLQMNITKKWNTMFSYFLGLLFKNLPSDSFVYFKKIPDVLKSESGKIDAKEEGYSIYFNDEKAECLWDKECSFMGSAVQLDKIGTFSAEMTFKFEYEQIVDARDRVNGWINIGKAEESEMILLGLVHESPTMGSLILNDLVNAYVNIKSDWEKEDITAKKKYINSTLDELSVSLDEKSQKMILFQQTEKTIMPEVEIPELLKKQETLKIQIEELKFKKKIIAGAMENIGKSLDTPISVPFAFEDLSTQEALKSYNDLLFRKSRLSQRVTEDHPMLSAIEKEIETNTDSLKKMLKETADQYDKGINILNELLSMISSGQHKIPENLFSYLRLKRDVELAEKVFVTLSAKLYESAIEPNVGIAPVRLIDLPDPFVKRYFPKAKIFAVIIFIITLFSGAVAIFIKEFLKAVLKSIK